MDPTVVIGAGPYGLSIAAHLNAARVPTRVFGRPMEFWRTMPAGMYLRSAWSASSLSAPDHAYSLDHFLNATGQQRQQPISLRFFVGYGLWFQRHAVPDVDPTLVRSLSADGHRFRVDLSDGRSLTASRVIAVATIADAITAHEILIDSAACQLSLEILQPQISE